MTPDISALSRGADLKITKPTAKVKRHFLESELATADDLIEEYIEYADYQVNRDDTHEREAQNSAKRQKLIWLLERLQESVL